MRRRALVLSLVAAVLSGALSPVASAGAADLGSLAYDMVTRGGAQRVFTRSDVGHRVAAASVLSDGSLSIIDDEMYYPYLYIRLADGARLEPGTTYQLGSSSAGNRITGKCPAGPGQLRVDDVQYSGTQVTVLAASFGERCDDMTSTTWFSGSIRIGSAAPVVQVRPQPVVAPPVGRARPSAMTVSFANTGTAGTAPLGQALVDPTVTGAADFSVSDDGCAGATLAPGDSCQVTVTFQRATGGTSSALVSVPDALADGGRDVAAVSGTATAAPNAPEGAQVFPVRGAQGVAWNPPTLGFAPTGYHVYRDEDGSWVDVSGALPATDRYWADSSLAPGQSADYRVVGENIDGLGAPSATVTGTRATQDPAVGSVDGISVDADLGGTSPYLGVADVVSSQVTSEPATNGPLKAWPRALSTSGARISLPVLLPGPGSYPVDGQITSASYGFGVPMDGVRVGMCNTPTGVLVVQEISFTPTGDLETLAANYRMSCPGGQPEYGELRWNSTVPFAAVTVGSNPADLGRVPVGQDSPATAQVTVTNGGTEPEDIGAPSLSGDAAADWRVLDDTCPASLPAGQTCTVDVMAHPSKSGPRTAQVLVPDSTERGGHHATVTVTGTSLPSPASDVMARRLPTGGVDLTWDAPLDGGGVGSLSYVVHRFTADGETTFDVPYEAQPSWNEASAPADVSYAVSMVNEIGQGPAGDPVRPTPVADALYTSASVGQGTYATEPRVLAMPDGVQSVAAPVQAGQTGTIWGLAVSPDGRSLLSTQSAAGGWVLWREPVDRSTQPVQLWSSTDRMGKPAWSPDGRQVAVVSYGSCCTPTLHVLPAAGGEPTMSTTGLDMPTWAPDGRTIVAADESIMIPPLVRVDAGTGRKLGAPIPGTSGAEIPAVSPDGRWIAFRNATSRTVGAFVIPVAGGTARGVPGTGAPADLAWSPDGHTLALVSDAHVALAAVDDSGVPAQPVVLMMRSFTRYSAGAWVGARVVIGPSAATMGPIATFALDASALPAGTALSCAVDEAPAVACQSPFRSGPLASGAHTLHVRSVEPDGRTTVAARAFTTDATAPAVRLLAPSVSATTASTVTASYTASDASGVASYDLRYRLAGTSGVFGAYRQPVTGTRATSVRLGLAAGYQYCVSVRARDILGNASAWSPERCIARALDDRALSRATAGWTSSTGSSLYLGTATTTTRAGASLTLAGVRARQVFLLATTCPGCGSVALYVGTTKIGSVSLYAARTHTQSLIALPAGVVHSGTLRVVVTSATGRLVQLDGVALRAS